jgi:hypothetical protein
MTRILSKLSLAAFRACRYLPGKIGSRPVAMWTLIKYFWKLEPPGGRLVPKLAKAALDVSAKARFQLGVFLGKYAETEDVRRRSLALEFEAAELGEPIAQISQGAR